MKFYSLRNRLENKKVRSAWMKGVKEYAFELLESLEEGCSEGYIDAGDCFSNYSMFETALLNGAYSWNDFSWGGCALIYDPQIAKRLCNNTEYKRTKGGYNEPNKRERWLDVQTRALKQAAWMLWDLTREV